MPLPENITRTVTIRELGIVPDPSSDQTSALQPHFSQTAYGIDGEFSTVRLEGEVTINTVVCDLIVKSTTGATITNSDGTTFTIGAGDTRPIKGSFEEPDSRFLNKKETDPLTSEEKSNLSSQWPEAVESPTINPKTLGAVGDGLNHPLSDTYASLSAAQVDFPKATSLTEEIDGHAIQKAIDTGRSVLIRNGYYKLSNQITLDTRGQVIAGESPSAGVFEWTDDDDAGIIQKSHTTTDPNPNGPGSADYQSALVQISNLWLIGTGKADSNSYGFQIGPREDPGSPSIKWNGPRTTLSNVTAVGWKRGFNIEYASKVELDNCLAKNCGEYGAYFGSSTNNCHTTHRYSAEECPVGLYIDSARGGNFGLGDFSNCPRGIRMGVGNAVFTGGELESWTTEMFYIDGGIAHIIAPRFLGGAGHPVRVTNGGQLFISAQQRDSPEIGFEEMVITEDLTSIVCGPSLGFFISGTRSAAAHDDYRVKSYVSSGVYQERAISPVPWVNAGTLEPELNFTGLLEFTKPKANTRGGSHLVTTLEDGDGNPYICYLDDDNHVTRVFTGTNGAPTGWETIVKYTSTATKNCNLPVTTSNSMRATAVNAKGMLIYNANTTGNLNINPNGSDTLNMVAAAIVLSPGESAHIYTNGDGDWIVNK
jgi:hypothetical protein